MGCRFAEVIVDSSEPNQLAEFWAAVLGRQPIERIGGVVEIVDPSGTGPSLMLIRVPEAKAVKNRIHFDVRPDGCTVEEEVQRIVGLGARRIDIGQGEQAWVVLADPEGNEFCVCPGV